MLRGENVAKVYIEKGPWYLNNLEKETWVSVIREVWS